MIRRSGIRRIGKWTGVSVCVMLVVAWVGSYWIILYPKWLRSDTMWFVGIGRGCVEVYYQPGVLVGRSGILFPRVLGYMSPWAPQVQKIAVQIPANPVGTVPPLVTRHCWYFAIPLWTPLLAIAVPTFVAIRHDRRHPPGHCQKCGYDLSGNVTGVCSECGRAV